MSYKCFENVRGILGFGCMRLPMKDGAVDAKQFCEMTDRFIEEGFNYFDTAHGYIGGKSETAIRECVSKRHSRDSFILTDKLTENYFNSREDIVPFFESQLKACGVDYFDFYLMHAQHAGNYEKYKACEAYKTAFELKKAGKVKYVGLSFHDRAEVLDRILTENPDVDAVQIQFNYLDYEDSGVQSRLCYEVCRKHDKPVIVMEPVRGGRLAVLPKPAAQIYASLSDKSAASYALRFVAGFEGIKMILSGMSNNAQMEDNIKTMKNPEPLSEKEKEALGKVLSILRTKGVISCTGCGYCVAGCPAGINIPEIFACMNAKTIYNEDATERFEKLLSNSSKPSYCVECGQCESACPQHLKIRELMKTAAQALEKN